MIGRAIGEHAQPLLRDVLGLVAQRQALARQAHLHPSAVVGSRFALYEAALRGRRDQAGDARLVELEVARQIGHRHDAVTQDAEQQQLCQRRVDVVIDDLWGPPTESAIVPVVTHRADDARALDWVQVGSVSGPEITLPAASLRATNLRLQDSGQGSVTTEGIVSELADLARLVAAGTFTVDVQTAPRSDVENDWGAMLSAGRRLVITP